MLIDAAMFQILDCITPPSPHPPTVSAAESWIRVNWMLWRLHGAAPNADVVLLLDCCREILSTATPSEPPLLVGDG
jgi:hypothetical protein